VAREWWEVRKIVTTEGLRCAPSPNPSYHWWINQRHTLVRWQKHSWEMQTEWTTRRSSLSHPFVPSFQPNNQPQLEFCRAGVSSQHLTSAMKPSKEESHVSRVLGLPVPGTLCLRKLSLNWCFGHDFSGSQIKVQCLRYGYIHPSSFQYLVRLDFKVNDCSWHVLKSLLHISPNLEILVVTKSHDFLIYVGGSNQNILFICHLTLQVFVIVDLKVWNMNWNS